MTRFATHRPLVMAALVCLNTLPGAAPCVAAAYGASPEVLNLEEAAALLQVRPRQVRKLAEKNNIPARQIGNDWRFSRVALLEWLANGQAVRTPLTAAASPGNPARIEPPALDLRARGMAAESPPSLAQAAPGARSQSNSSPPPTIGERSTTPTAEDIALRDQSALLKRGAVTADIGFSYSRSEQTPLPGIRVEQRGISATAALRYGLQNDLQIRARLPGVWRQARTYTDASLGGTSSPKVTDDDYIGDASLSLLGVAVREASGRPNVIWSVDGVLPTGPGDRGLGVGLVISKSYDPAVLFAGVSYLRGFSIEPANSQRSLAENNFGLSLGYTYALNDSLALNTVFVGSYRNSHSADGTTIPAPRENYQLQFGMTWMLARGLYLEPAVTMRLGSANADVGFSLNVPYSF